MADNNGYLSDDVEVSHLSNSTDPNSQGYCVPDHYEQNDDAVSGGHEVPHQELVILDPDAPLHAPSSSAGVPATASGSPSSVEQYIGGGFAVVPVTPEYGGGVVSSGGSGVVEVPEMRNPEEELLPPRLEAAAGGESGYASSPAPAPDIDTQFLPPYEFVYERRRRLEVTPACSATGEPTECSGSGEVEQDQASSADYPPDPGGGDGGGSDGFEKPASRRTSSDSCDLDAAARALIRPSSAMKVESAEVPNTPRGGGKCSGGGGGQVAGGGPASDGGGGGVHPMVEEAWERLKRSYVYYNGEPVGTLAATDPGAEALNYNQVFVRDFFPSGLACLMKDPPEAEIVKKFLLKTLHLQGRKKKIDNFFLGEGVMPASFKVQKDDRVKPGREALEADYGGTAIGRVAPIDSGFWWIILLRSYTKRTRDYSLAEMPDVQRGIKLILNLCLSDGFDTFPTLLCADGCCMIDRRMGIYGYPIEIQALFFFALRSAKQMLKEGPDNKDLLDKIVGKIKALNFHIRSYYWVDHTQLNNIYRFRTEEYSHTAVNKFNVIPESIPDWLFEFVPERGGYFVGNVSPARMDFRWFLVGNCMAILSSLATPEQADAIMDLIEERWEELIGQMPLKICYPALEGSEWRIVTGFDPKNTRWSYHNGGSWPVLLWMLTSACIKTGRPQMAKRAIELIETRLSKDGWPEYYDGKKGLYIGKQARKYQTWSIAGYLVAKMMIENPANLILVSLEEDKSITKPKLTRSASWS